jgi:hypothetical protein
LWSIHDCYDLEALNIPTAAVVCTGFEPIAVSESQRLGMPALGWAVVPYPLAGLAPAEREVKAQAAYPALVNLISQERSNGGAPRAAHDAAAQQKTIRLAGDSVNEVLERLSATLNKLRWSDGLPLVPPTREAVDEMLRGTSLPPQHVVARLYPNEGKATVEKIAINAVMAGCRPDYMPVLIAAVKGIATPCFNQEQTLVSTGSFFPTVLVNGPIAGKLDINSGRGLFGPGWRANAAIGRAIRLIIINIGGSWPDINDMGVMGHPGKYTCCIAENERASPWPSLAQELGYAKEASTVTMVPGLFLGYFSTVGGSKPEDVLQPLCEQLCSAGTTSAFASWTETLVVLNPVHAQMLKDMGMTKEEIRRYVYENTRFPTETYHRMKRLIVEERPDDRANTISTWPGSTVSMHASPDQIRVIVGGAEGTQGAFIRMFLGLMATHEIQA